MNNYFYILLFFISLILASRIETIIISLILIVYLFISLRKNNKLTNNIKILVLGAILIIRYLIILIPDDYNFLSYYVVIRKFKNEVIITNGFKNFIIENNSDFNLFSIIKIEGELSDYHYDFLESGFNFNNYLRNLGVNHKLNINNFTYILKTNNLFINYKNYTLKYIEDIEVKNIISLILYGYKLENIDIFNKIKILNLYNIFKISGINLYFIYKIIKKIVYKLFKNDKYNEICTIVLLIPYLIINITNFVILKFLIVKIFTIINKTKLNNIFNKLEIISLIYFIFLLINPYLIFQQKFYIPLITSFLYNFSGLLSKGIKKRKILYKYIFMILCIFPFLFKSNNYFNPIYFSLSILFSMLIMMIYPLIFLIFLNIKVRLPLLVIKFIIKIINEINFNIFNINIPSFNYVFLYVLYYLLLIIFLYFYEINYKKVYLSILTFTSFCMAIYILPIKNSYTFKVSFINVGQGDCTLLRYRNNSFLIDTGGLRYTDLAINNLIPYFRKERIYFINKVFITHYDFDHFGALNSLKENFIINEVIDYNYKFPCLFNKIHIMNLNDDFDNNDEENEKSLVLYFSVLSIKFLFMGDASSRIEEKIIKRYPNLKCDILKVGHHGSKTSSSDEFIKKVNPKIGVISCGINNKYHHPHVNTLRNLKNNKVIIKRTDKEGTIEYIFSIL